MSGVNIGGNVSGKNINIAGNDLTISNMFKDLDVPPVKEAQEAVSSIEKGMKSKDKSLIDSGLKLLSSVSVSTLTQLATKLALKAVGL